MLPAAALPSPLISLGELVPGVELRLKRDDLVHPTVPGNKWRKLAPNLDRARAEGRTGLLTFGGAYSTHLRATAAAAAALGLASVGVVRGEELAAAPRNWSLRAAEAAGMELRFVPRSRYRELVETAAGQAGPTAGLASRSRDGEPSAGAGPRAEPVPRPSHDGPAHATTPTGTGAAAAGALGLPELTDARWLVLPEGGSNAEAVRGAAEVSAELGEVGERDVVCCAVGTGGTLAGIAAGLPAGARALGVAVLRGEGYLEREVVGLQRAAYGRETGNWRIHHGHHGGGYGKVGPELAAFAAEFEQLHGVPVELRYVAKTLLAVHELAAAGEFTPGTRLTVVVTGLPDRLQGA
ncbi:1-aminocyclopropane-1-carboxylate deaminase [Kitasatospora sp. MMS16-BH015]|uniref:1-aminocyclopropane-1-carboxylate deaminase/D-cysteine desulfhydrase n=1 Tax=Kitasatospora sp. MMS16-BH015 TaxID=2018025 RepID=UPI000CA291C9|nr:pyridoxal-phosphate dependent enzyme [Kitasatospora sp. MMS16-BH015]AUG77095.1 1-aminocyclopropane-1-carboxylate deaminase [Kitasatospora sp. MMS16-BH015]